MEKKETMTGCIGNSVVSEEISLDDLGLTPLQKQVVELLDQMTDDDRGDVFYFYCAYCCRKMYRTVEDRYGCNCMRDE